MLKNLIDAILGRQSVRKRPARHAPPQPTHVEGVAKGEAMVLTEGKEPGRGRRGQVPYRTARDATAIDPDARNPIHPDSPNIPPV